MTETRTDTREALLDAAERLFADRGFAGVGVREIVEHAGANIAAISYHFGSKADLYRETVARALRRSGSVDIWEPLSDAPRTPEAAATALARFVRRFLAEAVASERPSVACGLIVREAAEPTEAIDCVIRDFIRPHQKMMIDALRAIRPETTDADLKLHAESIIGQLLHYRTFRPFIERIGVADFDFPGEVVRVADHIAGSALRALGCEERLVETALHAVSVGEEPDPTTFNGSTER